MGRLGGLNLRHRDLVTSATSSMQLQLRRITRLYCYLLELQVGESCGVVEVAFIHPLQMSS
jgi:hypothetical protein